MIINKQPTKCMLRLTVEVDLTDATEVSFIRALLMRLNVLHARSTPANALQEKIMHDAKIGEHWVMKNKTRRKAAEIAVVPLSTPSGVVVEGCPLDGPSEPAKVVETPLVRIVEQRFEQPKIIWRIKKIVERRMPAPNDDAKRFDGVDTLKK